MLHFVSDQPSCPSESRPAASLFLLTRDGEQPWQGYGDLSLPDGCPMNITTFATSDFDPSGSMSAEDRLGMQVGV